MEGTLANTMRKANLLLLAAFISLVAITVVGQQKSNESEVCNDPADVVKRGAALGNSPTVALAEVLEAPKLFSGRMVMIDGVVERNCTDKGCWMEIAPKTGAQGVRVTFKNYGFFIPLNSKGMRARAEGEFTVSQITKEKADHLEGEGAHLRRNADGSATEVTFIASGVEFRK
jgi:Domain of unknown function (DUF4920)